MSDSIKDFKKKSKQSTVVSSVGILITLLTFVFFIYNQEKTNSELEALISENRALIDSTKSLTHYVDSAKVVKTKNDLAKDVIIRFIDYSNKHKVDSVLHILSDTLDRFYLKKNISKYDVAKELKWYWNKYPNSTYNYEVDDIIVSKHGEDSFQVVLRGYYSCKTGNNKEVISYIRVDKDNKVFFTRDYLPN